MRIIDASDKDFHFVVAVTDDGRLLYSREPVAKGYARCFVAVVGLA